MNKGNSAGQHFLWTNIHTALCTNFQIVMSSSVPEAISLLHINNYYINRGSLIEYKQDLYFHFTYIV